MDKDYWNSFYKHIKVPSSPSTFAIYISKYLKKSKKLLELGCGNGRDSIYFSNINTKTVGIDQSTQEIDILNKLNKNNKNLKFISDDFTNISKINENFDYIYSRFSIHSVKEKDEDKTVNWISTHLKNKGYFFMESRSDKDQLLNKGTKLSKNENFIDHYRRYLNANKFSKKLKNKGFKIIELIESNNLSIYKNDNPVVLRVIAQKLI